MRAVIGYVSLLAALVIMLILAVAVAKSTSSNGAQTGEQKAARSLREPGDSSEDFDTKSVIRDTVRDAYRK